MKNMEIYYEGQILDFENVSITKFEIQLYNLGEKFSEYELDFSAINKLKGDKDILEKAFLHQFIEEINT